MSRETRQLSFADESNSRSGESLHASSAARKWELAGSSANLHLDELQTPNQDFIGSVVSFDQLPPGRPARRPATPEAKRREHLRLFKEYIACCRGPEGLSDSSPDHSSGSAARVSLRAEDDDYAAAASGTEYGSFLRPYRRSTGPRNTSSLSRPQRGSAAGGAGLAGSAGCRAASPASDCSHDVPFPRADANRPRSETTLSLQSAAGSESNLDEAKVYRSQVATALKAGRSVWL